MMKLFRSDEKFSQMLNQYEPSPKFGNASGSGGCRMMRWPTMRMAVKMRRTRRMAIVGDAIYGEPDLPSPSPVIDNTRQPQMSDMIALLNDLSYIPLNNAQNEPTQRDIGETSNEPTQAKRNEFEELYASANEELYPGCDYSSHTAKEMTWHATGKCTEPDKMQHSVDGRAWKNFDTKYPNFAKEPRNVRLGLAADGFNPFGNLSQAYNMWPVILTTYNLPPWLCMKESSFILTLLIPGLKDIGETSNEPTQAKRNEFEELYASANEELYPGCDYVTRLDFMAKFTYFKVKGKLTDSIFNEMLEFFQYVFPTLKGYKLPPLYYAIKKKFKMIGLGKGYKLPPSYYAIKKTFKTICEHDCYLFRGDDNKDLDFCPVCNTSRWKDNNTPGKKVPKKVLRYFSIIPRLQCLYKSSYTAKDMIWHATEKCTEPDIMHIEKNVLESILNTLLMNEKSKDTAKVRQDLKRLGIRSGLWLGQTKNGKCSKPQAAYSFTPENIKKFCQFIKRVKLPDGFGSNFKHKVTDNDTNITVLKSHDYHIMMQRLLPYGLQQYLPDEVAKPIIELCLFFKQICSATLMEDDLLKAQNKLKGYVRNKVKPKGSIAEGYVAEEALTSSSHYFRDVTTKFNRPDRNVDPLPQCISFSPEIDRYRSQFKSRDERRTTQNSGICSPGGKDGEMYYEEDPDVIHFNNPSDLPLSTSLNDLDNATLHIDGQSTEVDAQPDIIDLDENDDIIDDEDALPHDLAYSDDEDLVNMSADVARGHDGDGGGKGTRKPNLGGRKAGRLHTSQETRNIGLKKITDDKGPVPIRFECDDKKTLMPLGDHASHCALGYKPRDRDLQRGEHQATTSREHYPGRLDAQIAFWNDPRNQGRAAQNRQNRAKSTIVCRQGSRSLARLRDQMMESSATRDYPSLIHTFFVTHTVGGVFTRDENRAIYEEMLRLQGLGSNTPSGVPYTEEEINALARKGKQRGHLPGVGRVLPGRATDVLSPPPPQCTHNSVDVEKLKKKNKYLTRQVNLMMKLLRSDDKFSQMLNQYESSPEFGKASGSGGCGDDKMVDNEDGGEDEEDVDS
uniref:DUF4218 domain-containing protein n=1 Tax=Tanacetum cinerariifolium TaxID=118510 RepID=A0A6L2K2C9_TANCI|nr:hypothetical protein [Tanacetum cinerariifolium]